MTIDWSVLLSAFLGLIVAGAAIWIVAFLVFHSTELLKLVSRAVAQVPALNFVAIKGYGSYITAVILSAVTVFGPGSGLLAPLTNLFTALNIPVNTTFEGILVTFLTSIVASVMQNSGKMPSPLASSKTPTK